MLTSPISKMNDDCLLWTFDIITSEIPIMDSEDDQPLKTIRAASHSCHRWRQLLLSSPFIWGRLVDLGQEDNTFGPKRTEWMEEVMRRAASSPLWICGLVVKPRVDFRFDSWSFFIDVLQSWERIEKLSVQIYGENVPDAIKSRFLLPAPMLKLFDVKFHDFRGSLFLDTLQPGSSQHLFGNYAPFLQVIKCDKVAFKPNAPWLSGIREMVPAPPIFDAQDFFVLLQHTPHLKSILFAPVHRSWAGIIPPSTKPDLPNLSSISLTTNIGAMARIFDYISPRKLSFLQLLVIASNGHLNDDYIIPSLRKNLPVYIASYFDSCPQPVPVELQLKFDLSSIELRDATKPYSASAPQCFLISLLSALDDTDLISLMACIGDSLLRASTLGGAHYLFESIIGLTISLSMTKSSQKFSILHSMFTVFRDIEYIRINEDSAGKLWSISSFDQPSIVLFPKLRTVFLTSIKSRHRSHTPKQFFSGPTQFLKHRKEIGFPVQKFDLTSCTLSDYARDLRELEDIEGLEVVWKTSGDTIAGGDKSEVCSYICGSGDPQKLLGIF